MKVIIGAGKTVFEGWLSTQEDEHLLLLHRRLCRESGHLTREKNQD